MFLVGAAVGASVALLYAPQEGEATRRALGEKANAYKDKATEVTNTVAQTAKEKISLVSDKASELVRRGQNAAQDAADNLAETAREVSDSLS
jgi:gas vesicle protein